MQMKAEGVRKIWDRYKYAALVALIGAGLLLWPSGQEKLSPSPEETETAEAAAEALEAELETMLSAMEGVGQAKVMLTVDSDGERQLAQDTELTYSGDTAAPEDYSRRSEPVLAGGGSNGQVVVTRRLYPTYRGALVVCPGGDRAEVRLAVTEAVAALTGLTADRVTVAKSQ